MTPPAATSWTSDAVGPSDFTHIVVDVHDLPGLARFWTQLLGWKVLSERQKEIVIGTGLNAPVGMCFMPVTDPKTVKNRVYLDLTTGAADRDQEIDRLVALGTRPVDIGPTGAESWTILADPRETSFHRAPEGNTHRLKLTSENGRQTRSAACTCGSRCDSGDRSY
jgi:hypothetical protein